MESGGSHFTQVTAVVLRDTSTRGESFFNFLIFFKGRIISLSLSVVHCCTRILQSDLIGLCESQQPHEWSHGAVMVPLLCQWS